MAFQIEIFGRNMEVTDRIHDHVNKKVSRLDRYINGIEEARVELAYLKSARSTADRQVAQLTIRGKGFLLRSEERADDIFTALDIALEKIERRIERFKGKHYRNRGDGRSASQVIPQAEGGEALAEGEELYEIVRRKRFRIDPMDEMEAIEQMNLLGHESFFVFYNANSHTVNVLYKRRDGSYGLIEPEIG